MPDFHWLPAQTPTGRGLYVNAGASSCGLKCSRLVMRACAVAAAGTGEGKTSVALALARIARDAGHSVMPFKCGPDYLDAQLYLHACGKRARNVDLWLDGPTQVAAEFALCASHTIIVETMMGLFDGDDEGQTSSAHILAAHNIPTILVLDGWRASQTLAAVALGCASMQPRVRILGAILNRAGGDAHQKAVARALASVGIPLLASLPHRAAWTLPERHLGLDISRNERVDEIIAEMAAYLANQFDIASLLGVPISPPAVPMIQPHGPVIAFAEDEALMFTYPQTLDALRAAGAQCTPFSPLRDAQLPAHTQGVWLGGGYPELHAEQLEANASLRADIADAVAAGMPVYAECGGYMYLGKSLRTTERAFSMCGALNGETRIDNPALTIGYRSLTTLGATPLEALGSALRAYEFHYAQGEFHEAPAYAVLGQADAGARRNNTLASFHHRRFYTGDIATCRFVEACSHFSR